MAVEQPAKGTTSVRVRTDILDTLIDDVGELFILRERLESLLAESPKPELRAVLDELSKAIREVHDQVMTVRMTPVRNLTDRYPRLVRDLGRDRVGLPHCAGGMGLACSHASCYCAGLCCECGSPV